MRRSPLQCRLCPETEVEGRNAEDLRSMICYWCVLSGREPNEAARVYDPPAPVSGVEADLA
jgi:hypothetical protein